jgi:hypothetical protein
MKLNRLTILLILALAACGSQVTPENVIPPEEVLQRATRAVQKLDSAQYVAQSDFDINSDKFSAVGTARIDGMLQDAGEQLRFQLDLTADIRGIEGPSSVAGTLEVVVITEDEVYMNIHSLTSQPNSAIFRPEIIGMLSGKWWQLSEGDTLPVAEKITPDPRLLQAQAQVVSVTRDRGITTINGRDTHHYDTTLDKEKLVSYLAAIAKEQFQEFDAAETQAAIEDIKASGQLWIDAETYFVQKIAWVVQSIPLEGDGIASVSFTITFRNHNDAPAIIPPQNAKVFSPAVFFTLPTEALFQEELEYQQDTQFDEDTILDIMQNMNTY